MYVRDLSGREYPIMATSTIGHELNGNQTISATIISNKVNDVFLKELAEMWIIADHEDTEYKIIFHKRQGQGNSLEVEITGIPLFFDDMDNDRIYERFDQSMTANEAFIKIFTGTGYEYVLVDSFTAVQWENFGGGESKLETFKRALERYKAEFKIVGNKVFLQKQIGNDTNNQYRHRLNASDIVQETDANEFWTYARGYGDFEEGDEDPVKNAKLKREYTSPLAKIPAIGMRHAPPIFDGRVKIASEMDSKLKTLVEESLKVSVSAKIHELNRQKYPIGQSEVGDRVFLIDERINLDWQVRVVRQNVKRDWRGKILDMDITFGSEGLGKRYQSNLTTAIKTITDVFEGKRKLDLSFLDQRIQEISKIINGNTDSVFQYMPNGVVGWNGDNPNYMTRYVGDAIGFSTDGGKTYGTAMSAALGIVANYITTGELNAGNVKVQSEKDHFWWDADGIQAINKNDQSKRIKMNSDGLDIERGMIRIERDDGFVTMIDGKTYASFDIQGSDPPHLVDASIVNRFFATNRISDPATCNLYTFRRIARYLVFQFAVMSSSNNQSTAIIAQSGNEDIWLGQASAFDTEEVVRTITVDLGVPDGSVYAVRLMLKSYSSTNTAYCRKIRAYQTDFI